MVMIELFLALGTFGGVCMMVVFNMVKNTVKKGVDHITYATLAARDMVQSKEFDVREYNNIITCSINEYKVIGPKA